MKVVIDRIQEGIAVCQRLDNKEMLDLPVNNLPRDAKESDVLVVDGNNITIDKDYTEKLKKELQERMKNRWK